MRRIKPCAVDLFCGAGGLSYGMKRAGIEITAGIDADPACRHPFEANVGARFYEEDVSGITPEFIRSLFGRSRVRILAGCAPCQPFSSYSRKKRRCDRWTLLSKFGEMVRHVRPEIVTMENVAGLASYSGFARYVRILKNSGYRHTYGIVNCSEYGVPQTRRRLVLMASLMGDIGMPKPTHTNRHVTVKDAIRHMGRIPAGGASGSDRMHKSSTLSEKNMRRVQSSRPGGSWKDWKPALLAECHVRKTGRSYSSVYGRMRWDAPAPTITTQFYGFGSGRFGHPGQDRAISLREGALLQTFPEDYSFVPDGESVKTRSVGRMIGNAVPVLLGAAIGRCMIEHLEGLR